MVKIILYCDTNKQKIVAKIVEIDAYDTSSEVNGFTYQGTEFWLPRETHVSVINTANILKLAGALFMDLWLDKVNVNLPVKQVIQILSALELYAFARYNVTAKHKAEIEAMTSVEDVMAFDITADYPNKLLFNY